MIRKLMERVTLVSARALKFIYILSSSRREVRHSTESMFDYAWRWDTVLPFRSRSPDADERHGSEGTVTEEASREEAQKTEKGHVAERPEEARGQTRGLRRNRSRLSRLHAAG